MSASGAGRLEARLWILLLWVLTGLAIVHVVLFAVSVLG